MASVHIVHICVQKSKRLQPTLYGRGQPPFGPRQLFAMSHRGWFFFFFNCLWKAEFLCQPVSEYWNRTTILIPFLQAIKHFCNFILSYFMKRFAFLIDDTSYVPCSGPTFWARSNGRIESHGMNFNKISVNPPFLSIFKCSEWPLNVN